MLQTSGMGALAGMIGAPEDGADYNKFQERPDVFRYRPIFRKPKTGMATNEHE
jgi:hypothetical protein